MSREWIAFDGTCTARPLLGGAGNVEDHWLDMPGGAFRAIGLRAFDPKTRTWAIWWLDSRYPPVVGAPVVGGFDNGLGSFFSDATLRDRPVKVRFLWSRITNRSCRWEQALSPDSGAGWETNWIIRLTRTR